ncbi:uncharacterized protein N7446_007913 [Penicillium canescens]|uniref:Uncharacterized protein n=1 Tax=Penicillium canescens TaxID=5083 RepID=A0AAD6IP80_PENCN|nr:uncharacterized protein N7446_007913 [Penicillium canescens]KAJ6033794.1 hypothetical protein N7444_011565 [Penicillium canescens]KAJ6057014.1 hypothetical protein N7460_000288 [Penicillium canescens]KAJ6058330.1 hypothetical protein N7446_007913 [Penicillium canescens]
MKRPSFSDPQSLNIGYASGMSNHDPEVAAVRPFVPFIDLTISTDPSPSQPLSNPVYALTSIIEIKDLGFFEALRTQAVMVALEKKDGSDRYVKIRSSFPDPKCLDMECVICYDERPDKLLHLKCTIEYIALPFSGPNNPSGKKIPRHEKTS